MYVSFSSVIRLLFDSVLCPLNGVLRGAWLAHSMQEKDRKDSRARSSQFLIP